ncbi:MAG TPA: DPP IV N-terminal domain-containing protein [Planctomycetota bacterium]|nr:DPP IV N-terminal domain-containing protein [Planctomycetota bacterium]
MHRQHAATFVLSLIAFVGPRVAAAEDLTVEWMLDPANSRAFDAPRRLWLPDETLLLIDGTRPAEECVLERLDPRTRERRPAGDPKKLLEGWKTLLGEALAPRSPLLPFAAAQDSRIVFHEIHGDLFTFDLETLTPRRITNTEAAESAPRLSPDGRWLAYARDSDLHAAEVSTGRERRLTRDGSETRLNGTLSWVYWEEIMSRRDEAYWWSPDSTAILYLQTDESDVALFPLPRHEPATPHVRWQRYPKAGGVNPLVRAGIVSLGGGETRWIDIGRSGKEPSPREYIARAAWLPDSSSVALEVMNRAQNRLEVLVAARSGGESRLLHEETSPTWINLHDDLHFLPGGERFLWLSERDGGRRLHVHGLKGGPSLPLTSPEWVLKSAGQESPWIGSVAWIDAASSRVYFHAAQPSPIGTQLFRVSLDGQDLSRVSEGDGTHRVSVSPRGSFFVDEFSRSGVPPRLTLHRLDGSLLEVLKPSAVEKLEPFSLEAPKLFTVPADDGTLLSARLFEPAGREEGKKHPAIVYIYGGPGAPAISDKWDGTWYLWAQVLARRGFAVFSIDPRSALDQGKDKEDTVHRKFYGAGELKDILAGVRHLKGLPHVDPERVGIWGWSGGGTNTVYAMTRSTEFRAGIAVAGVADQRYYDTVYTERYMGTPSENAEGYQATAAAAGAANLHGRLLIVHGTGDDNVHPQNAIRLVDDLVAAGKQFELMLYPGRGHGIGDLPARRHLFQLMLDFWERNLRG